MEIQNLIRSLAFLTEVTNRRLEQFFKKENAPAFAYPELTIAPDDSPLNHFLVKYRLNIEEYIVLLLGLMPHLQPNLVESVIQQYLPNGGDLPEMGGVKGIHYRGMLPTGETALFVIGGTDIAKRLQVAQYFSSEHFFAKQDILQLEPLSNGEPQMSGRIILHPDFINLFMTGAIAKPAFGPDFPAKYISTKMDWNDLVLNAKTALQLQDIRTWLHYNASFLTDWGMEKKIKPGYRALFYGPPGTGKTVTASLLGKEFNRDVYRIDLSQVVSKYIGETEKNLEKIFTRAEHKDWLLFFDEADALFGKRSSVQSAHDKYANQETSYLLQRVEDFHGLVILASNFKSNIDQAFLRRFNAVIHFPPPSPAERYQIWKTTLPSNAALADAADIKLLAERYELTGAAIVGVVHYACLQTMAKKHLAIQQADLLEGIKREYEKVEKVFNG